MKTKLSLSKVFLLMGLLIVQNPNNLFAQTHEHHFCGTAHANEKARRDNPDAPRAAMDLEQHTRSFSENQRSQLPVYTIPVVFHILHQYGSENISDAQVEDAVRIMTEDFRKLNADVANTVPAFQSIAADCEIEFKLARLDPNGNCTNGIDRIVSPLTNVGDDDAKLNPWPRNKYLNIWVVRDIASGAAGYSMYPSSVAGGWGAAVDGIMILSTYVGSIGTGSYNRARSLTHEAGHWLNLAHTWGDSNSPGLASNCQDDDQVSDTPNTIGWTSCNLNGSSCGSPIDNVQNFMEYSYCSTMFTDGQRSRMRAALTSNTAQRSSLWTTANLNATGLNITPAPICAPIADFSSDGIAICSNGSIQFSDESWNAASTSWSWSFPGGNPSSSTLQNPTVVYANPGVYNVSLTATNATGSNTETKNSFIQVENVQPDITGTNFYESFESISLSNANWQVVNSSGPAWTIVTSTGFTGSKSLRLYNLNSQIGDVDDIITPSVDLTQFVSPKLYFKYAYAQLPNSDAAANSLEVYVSDNCGKTWTKRKTLTGTGLSTSNATSSLFTPVAGSTTQWKEDFISLSSFVNDSNVRFMFRFIAGSGNNIFLDDININSPSALNESSADLEALNIYPNPLANNSVVEFDLLKSGNVRVSVMDVLGRETNELFNGKMNVGLQKITLDKNLFPSNGIYFLRISSGESVITQKFLVK
jgi:PKD repeat protein